jgi:mono/diheme cytochrome c family protein
MTRAILVAAVLAVAGPAAAADGAAVYKKHCANCHGPDGKGTQAGVPVVGKSAAFVKEVVEFHPPPMNKLKLPGADVDAVAAYVAAFPK